MIVLVFGILFVANVFNISDNIKYGVGITILVVGIIGCCLFAVLTYIAADTNSNGGDTTDVAERKDFGGARHAALMLAVQSGMNLTQTYNFKHDTNINNNKEKNAEISKKLLLKMLKRENELRLSKEILEKYEIEATKYYDNNEIYKNNKNQYVFISEVVNDLQKKVANEFGFVDENEENYAINYLRSAVALYPNDESIKNAANYLKYNSVKKFPFNVNDVYIDINLFNLNNNLIKFSSLIKENILNIIISGSIT